MNKSPDILLIMPDQMRGDCLSLTGHPVLMTPNMDEIGANGACFRRAYAPAASCIPSRRSLMTGLSPFSHGMPGFVEGVPLEQPTLPQVLCNHGYSSALAGRNMHLSPYEEPYGYQTRVHGSVYVPDDELECELKERLPGFDGFKNLGISWNGWTARSWPYADCLNPINWTVRESRRLVRETAQEAPLFLTASFYAPHPPFIPSPFYMERYLRMKLPDPSIGEWAVRPEHQGIGCSIDSSRTVLEGERLRAAQAGYFASINQIDDQIYWLVQDFKARSEKAGRPWIILFVSDHGEMLGDHYLFRKCEPYDGSSRIPFLIEGSEHYEFKSGVISDAPVSLEDIMPTLLDAAEVIDLPEMEGKSLMPLLRGECEQVREYLHAEHAPCYSEEQAYHLLTDGAVKYIWRPQTGAEEFFDFSSDPGECLNLAYDDSSADQIALWRGRLAKHLKDRPEGFSDGTQLFSGRSYPPLIDGTKAV